MRTKQTRRRRGEEATPVKKIAEAIKAIPGKKDKLREAFDSVQSYSSSLATFALRWKDLEDHFAAIEKSFDERFKALQDQLKGDGEGGEEEEPEPEQKQQEDAAKTSSSLPTAATDDEATPRPDLRFFCANMDAKGLRAYIRDKRNKIVVIMEELAPAIRCAPDPALLVLDAIQGEDGHILMNLRMRRMRITLLEKLHLLSPYISASVREKAKKLAYDWKSKIPKSSDVALEALGFLQLVAFYNIVSDFPLNTIMDLFISVSRKQRAVDLFKSLGLTDKLPDLIRRLNSEGRQLEAVKFVYAFDMAEKFPPVPLLKAYIDESKKMIDQGVLKEGSNSQQAQNEATGNEMGALKTVLKAVEEYKLEAEYPREDLVKRIAQLQQEKADKNRSAASAAASDSKPQEEQQEKADKNRSAASAAASDSKPEEEQQSNKRPRPSSTSAAEIASNSCPPLTQTHPQLGLADRAPFMGVSGPYGLAATGYVYNHGGPNLSGGAMGHGASHSPPMYSLAATGSVYNHGGPNLSGSALGHGAGHSPPMYSLAATGSVYNHGVPNLSGSAMGHGASRSPQMYSLAATGSVYNHGGPNLSGSAMSHGEIHSRPRSYHPSESVGGTSSLYDRPGTYNGYDAMSGLPPSDGSSRYP